MLHAAVRGIWSLGWARFLLGLSEPGNWPAAAKAVAEWFPPGQRALGVGIFNAGSSLGSAIAPPMVAYLTLRFGWRFAFLFTGSLGILWLAAWLIFYQPPHLSRLLRDLVLGIVKGRNRAPCRLTAAVVDEKDRQPFALKTRDDLR